MVYCFMGASCTGKTTVAQEFQTKQNAKIYNGKDYLRLAKNPTDAETVFRNLLKEADTLAECVVFVVAETELLSLLPSGAKRILFQAPLAIIKERFAKRMNGMLPPPVATMVERKVAQWDAQSFDLCVNTGEKTATEICDAILAL